MSDVRDQIDAAYADGKRRITCLVCDGGPQLAGRDFDTMSLSLRDDGYVAARCWRATCQAYICGGLSMSLEAPPAFEPRPLLVPYRTVTEDDYWGRIWDEYRYPVMGCDGAREAGLRVLVHQPTTCVWRLRGFFGAHLGHITRTMDKHITTYKELDRPLYYYNHCVRALVHVNLWVFEDPMSAAVCEQPAIALLGTDLSRDLCEEIQNAPQKFSRVYVALDPGAEDAAMRVYRRLLDAGVPVTFVPLEQDFKDMTRSERKALFEAYA